MLTTHISYSTDICFGGVPIAQDLCVDVEVKFLSRECDWEIIGISGNKYTSNPGGIGGKWTSAAFDMNNQWVKLLVEQIAREGRFIDKVWEAWREIAREQRLG